MNADQKSPVTGDCHAGIRGSPGVKFPRATRLDEQQRCRGARGDRCISPALQKAARVGTGPRETRLRESIAAETSSSPAAALLVDRWGSLEIAVPASPLRGRLLAVPGISPANSAATRQTGRLRMADSLVGNEQVPR